MDVSIFGLATVVAITVLCYLVGIVVKAMRLDIPPARWTAFSAIIQRQPSRPSSALSASLQTASAAAIPGRNLQAPWWASAAPEP